MQIGAAAAERERLTAGYRALHLKHAAGFDRDRADAGQPRNRQRAGIEHDRAVIHQGAGVGERSVEQRQRSRVGQCRASGVAGVLAVGRAAGNLDMDAKARAR